MQKSRKHGKKIRGTNDLKTSTENVKVDNRNTNNIKVLKKSKKYEQALSLPTLCNINPRSIYNKTEEFHTFVKEEDVDVVFISESWERDYLPLQQLIKLEDHTLSQMSARGLVSVDDQRLWSIIKSIKCKT